MVNEMLFCEREKTNPADKNPLYKPWLAPNILVSSANDFVFNPNVLMPFGVVQKNISNIKK